MEQTLEIDLKLMQIAIILGYSMLRWRSAVDVMIPKKADSKRAEQLRVICLMEPDYNFMNKWMGKITMSKAESSNSIASAQFGSRKQKSAILHALNKALCFDTLRTMKEDSSLTVLDAKSCYDRIPPPLACVCLRRQGLPQDIINASFNSIKDMTHHVRTAYGVSTVSYERDENSYLHGILQGNGAGPCIWVMLSSPILDMLADQGNGAILNLPNGSTIKVVALAFVDDIDLIQKLPKLQPLLALQHDFDIWQKGLQTMSGALVWKKCDVYLLQNIWDDRLHHWKLADQQHSPGSITITTEGQQATINRKEPHVASLSLGVMFAPSGSMTDQVKHLRKKSEASADLLGTRRISPEAAWYSLQSSIMKTIEYPLLATTMSQKEVTFIMSPILIPALPRAKICRFFSRAVLYSLPMHHGLGLQNPYYLQGIRKLLEIMHEDCPSNPTQTFFQASDLALELFAGLGPHYMLYAITPLLLKIIPNSILRCLWEFLSFYQISFQKLTDDDRLFSNDTYIMKLIYESKLKPKEAATFNYCRLYLQATTLSDLITLDGKSIRRHVWHGTLLNHRIDSRIWPNQPKPTSSAWSMFRKTLQHILHTTETGVLTYPIKIEGWKRKNWKWFLCRSTSRLYEVTSNNLGTVHGYANNSSRRSRHQTNSYWQKSSITEVMPNSIIPVTVFFNLGMIHTENSNELQQQIPQQIQTKWSDFLRVQRNFDISSLDAEFLAGNLVLVSDGSYKDSIGSAAWILSSTRTFKTFATGQCPTTGPATAQDSHRSELFGILGGLFFLRKYLKKFQEVTDKYQLLIGLDNLSAMNYVFNRVRYPVVRAYFPDYDVIASARSLLYPFINYSTIHIAGHQDDNFFGPLEFLPSLNVKMDIDCKRFRGVTTKDLSTAILPNQQFLVTFQQQMLCKQVEPTIREGISANVMGLYWARHTIAIDVFPAVAWQSIGVAMKKETFLKRHWVVKHSTGICGVNDKLFQWKEKDSNRCVRCGDIENAEHVWRCQHISSQRVWDESLSDLRIWLIEQSSAPAIIEALINGLRSCWYDGSALRGCLLFETQSLLGWQHIITGKFHVLWMDVQQHHFIKIGRGKKSSMRWLASLISRIWKIAWTLWEVRNEYEHEFDSQNKDSDYNLRIEFEIVIGSQDLHPTCQYLFSDREITHLRTTAGLEYKRQWISMVEAARHVITSASLPITVRIAPLHV